MVFIFHNLCRWSITAIILIVANAIIFSASHVSAVEKDVLSVALVILWIGVILFSCNQALKKFSQVLLRTRGRAKSTPVSRSRIWQLGQRLSNNSSTSSLVAVRVLSTNFSRQLGGNQREEALEEALTHSRSALTVEELLIVLQVACRSVGYEELQIRSHSADLLSTELESLPRRASNL
jgi:hypothetical protein